MLSNIIDYLRGFTVNKASFIIKVIVNIVNLYDIKSEQLYAKVKEALNELFYCQGGFFLKNRLLDRILRRVLAGYVREIGARYLDAATFMVG